MKHKMVTAQLWSVVGTDKVIQVETVCVCVTPPGMYVCPIETRWEMVPSSDSSLSRILNQLLAAVAIDVFIYVALELVMICSEIIPRENHLEQKSLLASHMCVVMC